MNLDFNKVLNNFSEEKLPELKAFFIGLIVLIPLSTIIYQFLFQSLITNKCIAFIIKITIYIVFFIIWLAFWYINKTCLPQNKKEKIGIVIAIYSEKENERQQLKADFIAKLKGDLLKAGNLPSANIIFLKNHFSKQVKEAEDLYKEIEKINKRIKAHFYICGDIKKRINGKKGEMYYLSLSHGYVVHRPIPKNVNEQIAKDFANVLPGRRIFPVEKSLDGFEASAELVQIAVTYIIGIAAFVSLDPQLAFRLHSELEKQFNSYNPLPPTLQNIKDRIPLLISDEAIWIARWHYKYNDRRREEAKSFLQLALNKNNRNYGAYLFKAIIDFSIDKNIDEAFKSIGKAEMYSNGNFEWRYSKAFLYFWTEKYKKALKLCKEIKKQPESKIAEITLNEVRDFSLSYLDNDNPKVQLYFYLGYLSLFKRSNLVDALQDFESFLKLAPYGKMDKLKREASKYLLKIKRQMEIKD